MGFDQDDKAGRDHAIIDHLCSAFTSNVSFAPSMECIPFNILPIELADQLEVEVTMEELKSAVFSLEGDKAWGPDGCFSLMMTNIVNMGNFSGFKVGVRGPVISHLPYADDTLIFAEAKKEHMKNIERFLRCCEVVVGLKVNFAKTSLVGINCNGAMAKDLARTLGCKMDSFPLVYLGLPISDKGFPTSIWDRVIQRVQVKLALWQPRYLSLGGRVILLHSCLANLS
ncbi:hypothetical protein AMTRI_Chr11g151900 [Amborella trichopoda]